MLLCLQLVREDTTYSVLLDAQPHALKGHPSGPMVSALVAHMHRIRWPTCMVVCIYYKRLESGTFEVPTESAPTWVQMVLQLEGTSLSSVRYRSRYCLP